MPDFDVIIVGAGLSGIGAAYHLQEKCPNKTFAVLEGRANMGGTWDFFKYPGIRSDSDMYTLGFSFNPWEDPKAIADGPAILEYIKSTAKKFGIDEKIRFNHKVVGASWADQDKSWTIDIADHEAVQQKQITCNFLFVCSGYYNYEEGHLPDFPNRELFQGQTIHPQKWDDSVKYEDKKVVIIGSGATAITLLPELAKTATKVTMLQRSPTYIVTLPGKDIIANFLRRILPAKWAYKLSRWKNILFSLGFYSACKKWPDQMRRFIQKGVKKEMGDAYEHQHFDPKYDPWDQRLCVVPDGDFFKAVKGDRAEIVTDTIQEFTEKGILLGSGQELEADLIVTATGLKIQLLGGMSMEINGKEYQTAERHSYRGVLFSDMPNFGTAIGYTNASWTLKCDLNCHYFTRLINHMDQHGYSSCTPRFDENEFDSEPLLDFDAGYILRAANVMPKQGSRAPWKVYQNYIKDSKSLRNSSLDDPSLVFE